MLSTDHSKFGLKFMVYLVVEELCAVTLGTGRVAEVVAVFVKSRGQDFRSAEKHADIFASMGFRHVPKLLRPVRPPKLHL